MKRIFNFSVLLLGANVSAFSPSLSASESEILPNIPPITEPLSTLGQVQVKAFRFVGNRSFSEDTLQVLLSEYTGRAISAEELQEAKNKITQHYVNEGYINSGAVIPDQQVIEGEITFKIIEGELTQVEVSGNEQVKTAYIKTHLEDSEKTTLNINELQKRLQLMQQNPLFKRINAELAPSLNLGESILNVKVEEASPHQWGLRFNNHRSPSIGAYRAELDGLHRNLSGWGDSLNVHYGLTQGLNDYGLNYSVPINRYDTTLFFHVGRSDSKVVEETFRQLDVKSLVDSYEIGILQPWHKTPNTEFNLGLKFDHRSSETSLLGKPFSFSPGVRDGKSTVSVLRFTQEWLERSRTQVLAARSSFNTGLHLLNATINYDGSPDGRFFSWLGQLQWVRRLELLDSQLLFRGDVQLSKKELLPLEKLALGGATTVRGYRENQLIRDNGLIASLEWRIPISKWRMESATSGNLDEGVLQIAPFFDYGRAWNTHANTSEPRFLASAGVGLRWLPTAKVLAELYWGKALKSVPSNKDHDLQDNGVHFELYTQW
ncbi:MAG: hypothetical protein RIS84_1328 [Pseudomonadota bacterium]